MLNEFPVSADLVWASIWCFISLMSDVCVCERVCEHSFAREWVSKHASATKVKMMQRNIPSCRGKRSRQGIWLQKLKEKHWRRKWTKRINKASKLVSWEGTKSLEVILPSLQDDGGSASRAKTLLLLCALSHVTHTLRRNQKDKNPQVFFPPCVFVIERRFQRPYFYWRSAIFFLPRLHWFSAQSCSCRGSANRDDSTFSLLTALSNGRVQSQIHWEAGHVQTKSANCRVECSTVFGGSRADTERGE